MRPSDASLCVDCERPLAPMRRHLPLVPSGRRGLTPDDAMLKAGGKALIEPMPASNLTVTTPEDLAVAAALLAARL